MIRSSGFGAVLVVLACAAVVGAQAQQAERHIMVTEAGKPAQKCRVIKCWTDRDGSKLCQVQAIDSGEMMTIVQSEGRPSGGPGTVRLPAPLAKVVHWGGEKSSPPIAPTAPPDAQIVGSAQPAAKPSMWDRVFASSRPRVSTETKITPVPAMSTEKPTVLAAAIEEKRPPGVRDSTWGTVERVSEEDADREADRATAKAATIVTPESPPPVAAAPRPSPWQFLQSSPTQAATAQSKPAAKQPPAQITQTKGERVPTGNTDRAVTKAVATQHAGPDLGAKSAGVIKSEPPQKGQMTAGPSASARPAPVKQPTKPASIVVVDTVDVKEEKKPARPAAPETNSDHSLLGRIKGNRATAATTERWAGGVALPPIAQTTAANPPPPAAKVSSAPPPGMASWAAAAGTPPARPMMMGPVSMPASAPNAFTVVTQTGPVMQMPMTPEGGVPGGLNNAFTKGASNRPIPADMGRSYEVANGLQGGGQMGGAEYRPPFVPAGSYPPPMLMPIARPQPPAMPMPAPAPAAIVPASLTVQGSPTAPALQTLRDAVLPSEREMAVDRLRRCDWKRQPEVVEGLTQAAKSDPAATVRAACVRALGRMNVNTMPVFTVLTELKDDSDLRVRQEVDLALAAMTRQ